jgi:4-carboxymuconolactone decarboxylase
MTTPQPSRLESLRSVVPKLVELTDSVLFGDVWERPQLSKRDRSLLTIGVLTALYRTDQLRGHIGRGLDNGLSEEEIGELITHVAFYAGWPVGVNAAQVAKQVFDARGT